jgi:DNA-binding GntR family transcriptional regulator
MLYKQPVRQRDNMPIMSRATPMPIPEFPQDTPSELRRVARVVAPVREQVLHMLRSAILSGEWVPGARLVEREICERTGASRPSVREVLRQLEAEGLVTMVPNRGPVITVIPYDEAADIYELREVLESLATKHFVARATDDDVRKLRAAYEELEAAANDGNRLASLAAKDHFYDVLLDAAGNSAIRSTLKSLQTRISFLRSGSMAAPGRPALMLAEVDAIVTAIEARNATAAARAMRTHVRNAARTALASLEARSAAGKATS